MSVLLVKRSFVLILSENTVDYNKYNVAILILELVSET